MGTTAEKLTYLNETKNQLKTVINYTGAGLDNETFRQYPEKLYDKYLDILKDGGAELFSTLPQVIDSGTSLTLSNTANTKIDLELKPSALEQATTTGKNLNFTPYANGTSKVTNGITFTVDDEGKVIANDTATSTAYFYLHTHDISPYWNLPQDTYIISGCPSGGGNSTYQMGFRLYNNMTLVTEVVDNGNGVTLDTTSYTYNRIMLFIAVFNGQQCDNLTFKPMVRKASITDGSFEPYTNGPSPNPDYPQTVHSISGDNTIEIVGKNLFDGLLEVGSYDTGTGGKVPAYVNYRNVNIISVKPNTKYTFSINGVSQKYCLYYYDSNKTFVSSDLTLTTGTFTTPNNCYYVNIRCFQADYTDNYATLKVQLEQGETATTYVEYKEQYLPLTLGTLEVCKIDSYEDEFYIPSGKNLFEPNKAIVKTIISYASTNLLSGSNNTTVSINNNNTLSGTASPYIAIAIPFKFEANKTIYNNAYVGERSLLIYDNSGNVISNISAPTVSYTPSTTFEGYLGLGVKSGVNVTGEKVMFSYESSVNFEPYGSKWYLKKNIGKVVLDGSESWSNYSSYIYLYKPDFILSNGHNDYIPTNYLANNFTRNSLTNALANPNASYLIQNVWGAREKQRGVAIVINDVFTDLATWKTWLSNHNTDVYYVLETPEYVSLNDTLQEELNNISKAVSYDTQTNISQTNSDLPFVINATAIEKNGGA